MRFEDESGGETADAAGAAASVAADDASGDWVAACAVTDVPSLGARIVRGARFDIAVFRGDGDRVFALLDRCPHRGGPLSQGIVYGRHVACPLHNWQIDLETGQAQAPDVGCTRRFDVRLREGLVHLRRSDLLADPAAG